MSTPGSFFTLDGDVYVPTDLAQGGWSTDMVSGPSVVAALARELESSHGHAEFHPARLTVDLFAPVRFAPLRVRTRPVREGNRIRVADAEVVQGPDAVVVARATLLQLRRGDQPPGRVWQPDHTRLPPPQHSEAILEAGELALFDSDLSQDHWTEDKVDHQNASRKRCWRHPYDVVDHERATPFQRAAILSEVTSFLTNWSDEGVGFINADLTVAFSRLPVSDDMGAEADEHLSGSGVAVGTATMFDRLGVFGVGTTVAVANARRQVSYTR